MPARLCLALCPKRVNHLIERGIKLPIPIILWFGSEVGSTRIFNKLWPSPNHNISALCLFMTPLISDLDDFVHDPIDPFATSFPKRMHPSYSRHPRQLLSGIHLCSLTYNRQLVETKPFINKISVHFSMGWVAWPKGA
jgi:hypothetical protein